MAKTRRIDELREKLDSELTFEAEELNRELFDLRFKSSAEGLANPGRIHVIRRDLARIKTLLTERVKEIRGATPRS